ncbi:TPA: site-specific integrase [Serratia marcescens]|nr:site-specific integrase [Serratia marcescens]
MNNLAVLKGEYYVKYSKAGYAFDIRKDIWQLTRNVKINFSFMYDCLDKRCYEGFINTFSYYAQEYNPNTINSFFSKVKSIILLCNITCFSEHELISAYSGLKKENYNKFSCLRVFLNKWKDLGYDGIDDAACEYLNVIKIPAFGYGDHIKRRDPKNGPFNDQEIDIIIDNLKRGKKEGLINDRCYVLIKLLLMSGRRSTQMMHLKHKDVIIEDGRYYLNMPRIKQRGCLFRSSFRKIEITEDIWLHISKIMKRNIFMIFEHIAEYQTAKYFDDLPIFLSIKQLNKVSGKIDFSEYLKDDFLHATHHLSYQLVKQFVKKMEILSPRTNNLLSINPRRFRYTYGTLLARDGGSKETIALAMDHSSCSSASVYIKNLSDNVNVIDKAIEHYLKDIADVFLGKRSYQGDLLQKIFMMDIKKENNNKRSCEGCQHFISWRDSNK